MPFKGDRGVGLTSELGQAFLDGWEPPPGVLISAEGFTASQSITSSNWKNFQKFLNRAYNLRTPPKILFVIREHQEWLRSEYIDRLKKNKKPGDFTSFLNTFSAKDLSWSNRIDLLEEAGFDLLVVLQNDMKKDSLEISRMISSFWEIPYPGDSSIVSAMQNPRMRKNINPINHLSVSLVRLMRMAPVKYLLLTILRIINRSCQNNREIHFRTIEDILVKFSNRIPLKNIKKNLVVEHEQIERLNIEKDWLKAIEKATRLSQS
jgi:hypothetical protein